MLFIEKFQKGVALPLSIIILSIILAIALGLTAILVSQIRIIRGMGYSVNAFFAADTGIERVLKVIIKDGTDPQSSYSESNIGNGSSYVTQVVCCKDDCENGFSCPPGLSKDNTCHATRYCIRSVGAYRDVKRAIEAKVYPP